MSDMTDEEALAALEEFPVSIRGGIIERARIALREKVAKKPKRPTLEEMEVACRAAGSLRRFDYSNVLDAADLIKTVREDTVEELRRGVSGPGLCDMLWAKQRLRALGEEP